MTIVKGRPLPLPYSVRCCDGRMGAASPAGVEPRLSCITWLTRLITATNTALPVWP